VDSQGLAAIGLGQAVIDWIELLLGPNLLEQGDIENPVAVFVRWMGSEAVRIALSKLGGRTFTDFSDPLILDNKGGTLGISINSVPSNLLEGMTGDSWPSQLFLLSEGTPKLSEKYQYMYKD
jgi:hypothetical protein